jgi:hypothetical protein
MRYVLFVVLLYQRVAKIVFLYLLKQHLTVARIGK